MGAEGAGGKRVGARCCTEGRRRELEASGTLWLPLVPLNRARTIARGLGSTQRGRGGCGDDWMGSQRGGGP